MKDVELYGRVRYAVRIEGLSERAAARRFGIDPRTVHKMMKFSVPPGYVAGWTTRITPERPGEMLVGKPRIREAPRVTTKLIPAAILTAIVAASVSVTSAREA